MLTEDEKLGIARPTAAQIVRDIGLRESASRIACGGGDDLLIVQSIVRALTLADRMARGVDRPEIIRHRKGGEYEVLARGAQIQTDTPLTDYAKVDVYRSMKDGATWVRPVDEMHDGRFEVVGAPAPQPVSVPCHRCSGTGWATWEDRHTETNRDRCTACGGTGREPAATGERREASFDPAAGRCFGEGEGA